LFKYKVLNFHLLKMRAKISLILIIMTLSLSSVMAITASIGNLRMTLRVQTGEVIEKYILVKNVNDFSVKITLTPSGDLKDNIILKDLEFELAPKEEKKAYFTIKSDKPGTTESRIGVRFSQDKGNSAGLSSVITLIASGEKITDHNNNIGVSKNDKLEETTQDSNQVQKIEQENKNTLIENIFSTSVLIIAGFILLAILIVVFFYSLSTKQQKRPTIKHA